MAFLRSNWSRNTDAGNTGAETIGGVQVNGPALFTYQIGTDTAAEIEAANYFAPAVYDLAVGDLIFASGSDAFTAREVAAVDREAGTITTASIGLNDAIGTANIEDLAVTTAKLAADAVTNAKLADDAVSLENLDAGITPSHITVFADQETTVGGAAAEGFTVTGVADTDLAFVQVVADGTSNVTVLQAVCTLNTLTVTFSADPVADTVFNYQILRAAS